MLPDNLEDQLKSILGTQFRLRGSTPLGGGYAHAAYRIDTTKGPLFVKLSQFQTTSSLAEAAQLISLKKSPTSLYIPNPIAAKDANAKESGFLVLPFLAAGQRASDWDERLGRGIAELHQASPSLPISETSAPHPKALPLSQPAIAEFGFKCRTYCGTTHLDNQWQSSWITFFREQRLRPLFTVLNERGTLSHQDIEGYKTLLDTLGTRIEEPSTPSLIHGDLWSGNILSTSAGTPALIDPAAYYAHPEAEFGLTTLFGGFSDRFYSAYQEVSPLEHEWKERNLIYRLWHLANHAVLFGGTYTKETIHLLHQIL